MCVQACPEGAIGLDYQIDMAQCEAHRDCVKACTVAGAIEGSMLDIRSIALSQAYSWDEGLRNAPWHTAESLAPAIIAELIKTDFPRRTCVNVNFPNCEPDEVAGTEVTRQGTFTHGLYMEKRHDGRGFPYYWLRFGRELEAPREGTDIKALAENRVTITPLKLDLTDDVFSATLRERF